MVSIWVQNGMSRGAAGGRVWVDDMGRMWGQKWMSRRAAGGRSTNPSSRLYAPLPLSQRIFPFLSPSFPLSAPLSLSRPLFPSPGPSFRLSAPLSLSRPLFPSLCPCFPHFAPLFLSLPIFPLSQPPISHTWPLNPSLDPFSHLIVPSAITLDLLAGDLLHALKRGISVILSPDKLLVPFRHESDGMANIGALGEVDDEGQHLHHGTIFPNFPLNAPLALSQPQSPFLSAQTYPLAFSAPPACSLPSNHFSLPLLPSLCPSLPVSVPNPSFCTTSPSLHPAFLPSSPLSLSLPAIPP
ncbi:unnamed protein product [Closterium sp. Naga37s-1]|nr:unnamed protein product [Closterium sp. Naga37s-1]